MAINLYDTHTMLSLREATKPKSTFLRDRYFPTAPEDIFTSEDVVVDFQDETSEKLAPVVTSEKGSIPVARSGYDTYLFAPPLVAPERILTASDLLKRQAGENVFSSVSPQQREASILLKDMDELTRLIDNREEYMAAQTIFNNGYSLRQYGDKYGTDEYAPKEIKFYEGDSNPATFTISTKWDQANADIISDVAAMATELKKRGLPASDLIVSGKVADVILSDETILKYLDNRRFLLSQEVSPDASDDGSTYIATFNFKGHNVNVYSYTRQYKDEVTGVMTDYVPEKFVAITAPGMGRTAYGAIVQMEGANRDFVTYAASRVPHVVVDEHSNTRSLIMQAKPLVMPKIKNSAITAQVLS